MNIYFIIFFIISFTLTNITTKSNFESNIEQHSKKWTSDYIANSSDEEIQVVIDLILLSYQIIKASCRMTIAKFTIQQELFKIYTPSFIDSWHDNLQIQQNNTTKLETALVTIKESQSNLQNIYSKFKQLLPLIIKIDPQPTQTLISDLKDSLIVWGKDQQNIANQLVDVQEEFTHAIATISNIKDIFATISQSAKYKHAYLKETATFFAKTYKDLDHAINHLATTRIQVVLKIQEFFDSFFRSYYSIIYTFLTQDQKSQFKILATDDRKTPSPDAFFNQFSTITI